MDLCGVHTFSQVCFCPKVLGVSLHFLLPRSLG